MISGLCPCGDPLQVARKAEELRAAKDRDRRDVERTMIESLSQIKRAEKERAARKERELGQYCGLGVCVCCPDRGPVQSACMLPVDACSRLQRWQTMSRRR